MTEEVMTLVKIPISEIEQWIRERHNLPKALIDYSIQGDALVLHFSEELPSEKIIGVSPIQPVSRKRRRSRRKRNRMKTRGWNVVARITNSKGQKCSIYEPFAKALSNPKLTRDEQIAIVTKILKSNKNRPSEDSIMYFLENTLDYLEMSKEDKILDDGHKIGETATVSADK